MANELEISLHILIVAILTIPSTLVQHFSFHENYSITTRETENILILTSFL